MRSPLESAKFIAARSEHVNILEDGVLKAAKLVVEAVKCGKIGDSDWSQMAMHPKATEGNRDFLLNWYERFWQRVRLDGEGGAFRVFFVDTINFSFWTESPKKRFAVTYKGEAWTGYFAACACVNRALDDGVDILNPHFYSTLSLDQVRHIFRGDDSVEMPLLQERLDVLRESGQTLIEKFGASFSTCVERSGGSVLSLLRLVVDNLASYRDEARFDGEPVSFWKRAQILCADVCGCLRAAGERGAFGDVDALTMFADYRVPQVLVYLGALGYSASLRGRLTNGELMLSGERAEAEIRGCSILACERIVERARQLLAGDGAAAATCNAAVVDYFLWCYRRQHVKEIDDCIPFHRVRCIYY